MSLSGYIASVKAKFRAAPSPRAQNKLRTRWIRNSVLVAGTAVVVAVIAFAAVYYNYYYSAVRTAIETKAKTASDFFESYTAGSYYEYYSSAISYTQSFPERDRLELQFVTPDARVVTSSLGLPAGTTGNAPDIDAAVASGAISVWVGKRGITDERVMAVSAPLRTSSGQLIGVMRYITGLSRVERQITVSTLSIAAAGAAVLVIVIFMNILFIRHVIAPVGDITTLARRIADGAYGAQIENRYGDEIGEMVETINEMSHQIGQSEKMKTEFISTISHELRTPLTAITGWAETIRDESEEQNDADSGVLQGIDVILHEARRLNKMVEELLEFTRMEDGRFKLNIEMIDLVSEVEEAIFTYRELLNTNDITLRYLPYDGELPLLPGDPNRLKQVFFNLLDNAAKYGKDGKRVDISVTLRGDYAAVTVRDYGPGVPPGELSQVKTKFFKGSNFRERGSGIGLAVCDEIMRYHGGSLLIENVTESGGAKPLGLRAAALLPLTNTKNLSVAL
ncbi:MAG: HAMP domain-containing histidine kinase [Oscillospiraceae bacterium]|nr:HAMP domain-containing histidine kinase [Oscillospiraceae bacterium]